MTLAVVGSRSFLDYKKLCDELNLLKTNGDFNFNHIVSGGAKGADSLAEKYAKENGIRLTVLKPNWNKYGKKAGILRNIDIVNESQYIIAFWDGISLGTKHSIDYAKKSITTGSNKGVKIIKYLLYPCRV
jgi:hypothetical protein